MKRSPAFLALTLLGLLGADASAADRPHFDAWSTARPGPASGALAAPDVYGGLVVVGRDPRGMPSLAWGAPGLAPPAHLDAVQAARHHLTRHRGLYGVTGRVIADARVRFVHDTGRGGIIVAFRQTVGGVDVFHGDVKVLMDRQLRLVGISGTPHPAATPKNAQPFAQDGVTAIHLALRDLYGDRIAAPTLARRDVKSGWVRYDLAEGKGLRFDQPARVKRVYFPVGERLVPAHLVELQTSVGHTHDVYQYVLSARDGQLLYRNNATAADSFKYRVWADPDGDFRPLDGPIADWTPHPTGFPEGGPAPNVPSVLIDMEGFNTNPDNKPDPWLPPGATETRGNNVDAYVDHSNPDGLGPGEFRADVTAPGVFDYTYDPTAEPLASIEQSKASIVQIFYTTNWLHDWWYDSGFNEAAGNAQFENFGRGGESGDPLLAEAQDAALVGARNNANMSTPLDGSPPRMQMYLWTGDTTTLLDVQPLNENIPVGRASFGPQEYDVTGQLVLGVDGGGVSVNDGCEPFVVDVADKIVLVDRGNCTFETKVNNAQAGGAIGTIIANNVDAANPPTLGNDAMQQDPTIPAQSVTLADGATLKAAIQNGTQTAHMFSEVGVERDGTLDNLIVAHEWGHYFHHRLVDCGMNSCRAMSEGWGDWLGLHLGLREGDDLDGTYADAVYAAHDKTGYFGIRRVPYSVSTDKNALTFRHIANGQPLPDHHPVNGGGPNSEVHNAGEIWATMLWQAYVDLHKAHAGDMTFDQVRRLMGDYIVAGMMMTPVEPTFTQQRDAILMAIAASSTDDLLTVAQAFATRGMGTCAIAPPIESTTFVEVVEDFQLQADNIITGVSVDDDVMSCDSDGVIDRNEIGAIHVNLVNRGPVPMPAGTLVEVISPDPALVFPNGTSIMLGAIPPLELGKAAIQVAVADDVVDFTPTSVTVRVTSPEGCVEFTELTVPAPLHGDVQPAASAIDDVEVPATTWVEGGTETGNWTRAWDVDGFYWHGPDVSHQSDFWLESPLLDVSEGEPFVVTFDHAYKFEYSQGTYWDGGVIEVSDDGGQTWRDVTELGADPGYGGDINSAANPLDGRPALVDESPLYPDFEERVLDFGMALAGKQVKLRFRIGTDAAAGAPGWDIDNIAFAGI
ncbi:MAG TPA: M36 family metallopeptidase, partial [Nannocystis sp.]